MSSILYLSTKKMYAQPDDQSTNSWLEISQICMSMVYYAPRGMRDLSITSIVT